jgi:hypothetical protein
MHTKRFKVHLLWFANVILPLIFGSAIYVFFRSTHLRVFRWIAIVAAPDQVMHARNTLAQLAPNVPEWILFSLPDSLWVYSFTSFMALVWRESGSNRKSHWLILPFICAVASEFGQLVDIIPGTYDNLDVLLYSFAALISIHMIDRKVFRRRLRT